MKKIKSLLAATVVAVSLASCTWTQPAMLTSNAIGSKVGKSSGTCYFRALCFDADWSIQSAAKNGGINKVASVDIKQTNILGIIWTFETIVTGE